MHDGSNTPDPDSSSKTIVMVHGLWMNGIDMTVLRRRLTRRGYQCHQFAYATNRRGLADNTIQLRDFISALPAHSVHLVGHSLGGVLILHALARFPTDKVQRIVCLGSPLVDSAPARMMSRLAIGRQILGRTLRQGVLERPLKSVSGAYETGVIAGTRAIGLGRMLGVLEQPHDGMVTVKETRLPGITDRLELPVNHVGMLVSEQVARQTAHFLHHGRFNHQA